MEAFNRTNKDRTSQINKVMAKIYLASAVFQFGLPINNYIITTTTHRNFS